MKCPHCEEELPGYPCPECGEMTIEGVNYCQECGSALKEGLDSGTRETVLDQDEEFDLENRELCPDGACTGIIIDGKCSECGKTGGNGQNPVGESVDDKEDEEKEKTD